MTLPTGTISMSQVNTEMGRAAATNITLAFINTNTKAAYRANNLNMVRGFTWYRKTNAGACNNGACNCNCNCFPVPQNCRNCSVCSPINCANCDATNFLQPNCNCACTYNCTGQVYDINNNCYDCDNCG